MATPADRARQRWHQRVRDRGDGGHGRQHQPDRQQRDPAGVGAQVAGEEKNAAWSTSRGQEQHQDQLGRQLGGWHPGHEPGRQAAQHRHDRAGATDRAGQDAQPPHGHHEHHQQQLQLTHAITPPAPG
jgi:hypothetical protein